MHELSMCRAIADVVRDRADGRQVQRIYLSVGSLRPIVPESLQFCWKVAVAGSSLEAAELFVDEIPATMPAPDGGVASTTGEEFIIESIDLAPAETEGS